MPLDTAPVLVTGAAGGSVGGVGRRVVEKLRRLGVPVRALVRREDERAEQLRQLGAEVVIADLTKSEEVAPAVDGCRRVLFCMSVSSQYLEATAVMTAALRAHTDMELLVNLSQMTVSEMTLTHVTKSPQHRVQWLSEQILNWSGVPVAHLRPTAFQENPLFWTVAAASIQSSGTIRLPFGQSRVSPISANDVAEVAVKTLLEPKKYVGRVLELTGPRADDMNELAAEYSAALDLPVRYENVPLDSWKDDLLQKIGLPDHVYHHILTMAELHGSGRYDRTTGTVEELLGRPAESIYETIKSGVSGFPIVSKAS